jgi:DNA-binding NtrC family response regulator
VGANGSSSVPSLVDTVTRSPAGDASSRGAEASEKRLWIVFSPDTSAIGRVAPAGESTLVFGRDVDVAFGRIADGRMSRTHFRVVFDARGACHRLGDAESRNGTTRNGERVQTAKLEIGDVLRAGDTLFVYGTDELASMEEDLERIARSQLSVLILGETGVGKERVARALHAGSVRTGPFLGLNCAALPRELIGAELFGHTRGAFSGAHQSRSGLFLAADGGTLLLDEIADLPLELQGVLLRVLQERTVRPIGADQDVRTDVRMLAATHANLEEAVAAGRFRGDLYARLAQVVMRIPPLRRRRQQVLELSRQFAGGTLTFEPDAAEALLRHDWPFNVRELESLIASFVALRDGRCLDVKFLRTHCPQALVHASEVRGARQGRDESSRAVLENALRKHHGNVSAAAKDLQKPRGQVYRWLKALGLEPRRFR